MTDVLPLSGGALPEPPEVAPARRLREAGDLAAAEAAYAALESGLLAREPLSSEDAAALRGVQCGRARCLLGLSRSAESVEAYRAALATGAIPRTELSAMARAFALADADDDMALAAYIEAVRARQVEEAEAPVVRKLRQLMDRLAGDEGTDAWWHTLRWATELHAAVPNSPTARVALGYVCARWGARDAARSHHEAAQKGGGASDMAISQQLAEMIA